MYMRTRIEQCFEVVESVRPLPQDIEPKIDLDRRICNHSVISLLIQVPQASSLDDKFVLINKLKQKLCKFASA